MPDTPNNSPGQIPKFVGKYKIIRVIARSNDTVYEALDPHLGRRVALKELTLPHDIDGAARRERIERFQREAKAAGALKHPNIVTIYEVGQHLDHRFIAMEYLEGQTLREAINVGGPMSVSEALRIALQLCDALGVAHAQGVVHRDVKPDNIHLVPPNSTVKLTDFGIARVLAEPSITSAGQVFGTPSYMSPEQLTSRQVDHRSDIFSTAVVLYEMLTGKKPFRGDNVVAVTYQIMNTQVEMPPSVPPGLSAILLKALSKDPDLRYQNMRTFAADLRREMPRAEAFGSAMGRGEPGSSEPTMILGRPEPAKTISGATIGMGDRTARGTSSLAGGALSQPGALITLMDSDDIVRRAVARLVLSIGGCVVMVALVAWALLNVGARYHENMLHARGLGYYRQALAQAASGNTVAAITNYRRAMGTVEATDSILDLSREGISDCLTAQGAQAQNNGDLAGAQESYDEAIAMYFASPVTHFDLATLYQLKGDPVNALREFTLAYQTGPLSIAGSSALSQAQQGYLQLGAQDFSNGNLSRARQNWQRVIDLGPSTTYAERARERMQQVAQ